MIDLYYWTTPNGHKVSLFLEEAGLPYTIHPINISKNEQFAPDFLKISPNNRIPAIVDQAPADGGGPLPLFESGAILLYLAEKTGRFLPKDLRGRQMALQWLFWQMGGLGPMAGQNHHFNRFAVLGAQLENMGDYDAALDFQCAFAVRAWIARDHVTLIGNGRNWQIAFPVHAEVVFVIDVGANAKVAHQLD